MGSVDDRVVGMRFNNSTFERGVRTTLGTLDKLKKSLDFSKSTQSMNDLESAAGRFHMGSMGTTISGISGKLLAMGTIGVTALANITNRAVSAGIQLGKSLTIDPIMQGFHEYETQLGSIQTILANTGLEGKKGLDKVNAVLNDLNKYSDKTIYNFTQMAKNIGTFTAAGVGLDTSASAIKGIANLAALSGSNSDQASTAMYQLSQAISNNKVGLQDWNSVVNAGMGGKVFQTALFNMAKMKGTLKGVDAGTTFDEWTKAGNSFRNSLQEGWITGEVLTSTLSTFTGDMTDAQLKQMGFQADQIKAIQKQAKVAQDAATKVKTITQLMDTLKEAVGSGWGRTFATIFGNFTEARDLWTSVSNALGGLISKSAKARNKLLSDWKDLGGRTVLIDALWKAFADLGDIIHPIKLAFRDIFPAQTGKTLYDLTVRFKDFMDRLASSESTMDNIRRTFRGVFAIFDILWQVIKAVASAFGTLFSAVGGGSGGFLNFTGNIGDMLVAFDEALKKGNLLTNFFGGIASVLAVPIRVLGAVKDLIFGLFDGFNNGNSSAVQSGIDGVSGALDGLSNSGDTVKAAWNKVVAVFQSAKDKLQPITDALSNFFSGLGHMISDAMGSSSFDSILKLFNTVLLGGIALVIKKFLSGGIGVNVDLGGGFLRSLSGAFGEFGNTLHSMQTELKAKALLELAGAVALLVASIVALSMIKPKKLDYAVKGLAIVFGELLGAMAILGKISSSLGFIKIPLIAGAMVLISGAILILVLAVKALAKLDWESLKKGLIGVGVLLAELAGAATILSLAGGNLARTGASLIAFAIAIRILANAVAAFSKLSWPDMIKGLVGVGGALAAIALGMRAMPPGMVLQGAGLLAIGIGLDSVATAVKKFASLKPDDITKGLIGVGLAMATIAGAMRLMPAKGMVANAAGLLIVSFALQGIARAVAKMGALDFATMGKGLVGIAGSLAILAVAMKAMKGTISGAVGLGIASAALLALAPALKSLGNMSWSQIAHGLIALGGAIGVLAVASRLLQPMIPAIAGLGVALLAFSAAVLLAGAGVYLLGKGIGYLAEHGAAGISILLKALDGIIERLPKIAGGLAHGLVDFVTIVGENSPKMIGAIGQLLRSIMQAIIDSLPKALELFTKLIDTLLQAVENNLPKIVETGLRIIVKLLQGVANAMPKVIKAVADVIEAFLNALGDQLPRLIDAGFRMVIKVLNGIADAIDAHEADIIEAGFRIGWAIIKGIPKGIAQALGDVWGDIWNMLDWLWHQFLGFFGISSPSKLFMQIGSAIIEGVWEGIKGLAGWLWDQVSGWLGDLWGGITDFLGIGSPSRLFAHAGELMVRGMAEGVDKHGQKATDAVINMGKGMLSGFHKTVGELNANPVITPVLDLSNIRKDASKIPGMFGGSSLSTDVSVSGARALVSVGTRSGDDSKKPVQPIHKEVTLNQNNYSPKALAAGEIYKQTKNQLSLAKEVLDDDQV